MNLRPIPIQSAKKKLGIAYFQGPISCGLFGIIEDFTDSFLSLDKKFVKNKNATFFIRAAGDSMFPEIKPNDILIVDRSLKIFSGAVGAFFYNNNAICKQYINNNNQVILRSYNNVYEDILVSESDTIELFGIVVGLARDFY